MKPATIRTVFSLAVSRQWPIHQLDVKNAFLNGDLFETALSGRCDTRQLLERAHMVNCNPSRTPINTDSKLGSDGVPVQDPTLYRSLAGGLLEPHFASLKRIMRYVQGTDMSTSGYCVFLGDYTFWSWLLKRQHTISRSSAEAEYRGVANVVAETAWIRNLLCKLHSPLLTATLVYCDNVSAVYMSANPVQLQRTKHIEIDIHFVCDMVKAGHVWVLHVPSRGHVWVLHVQFLHVRNMLISSPKVFPQLCLKIFAPV
ncbi:ribonuclease H-like domain-containing protein [Tanacetum coccineum]